MNRNMFYAILLVSALVIGIVIAIAVRHKKEGFRKCICSGIQAGRGCACQDTEVVQKLYDTEKLTEFSTFISPGWSTVSPGDIDWPKSQGCGAGKPKEWVSWDFTEFGSGKLPQ